MCIYMLYILGGKNVAGKYLDMNETPAANWISYDFFHFHIIME